MNSIHAGFSILSQITRANNLFKLLGVAAILAAFAFSAVALPQTAEASDPFEITSWTDLNNIRISEDWDPDYIGGPSGDYVLVNDLGQDDDDYATFNSGDGWEPISLFEGHLDGGGHVISGLFIHRLGQEKIGLFSEMGNGASVSNLGLTDVDITGGDRTGGLAGAVGSYYDTLPTTLSGVYVTGVVKGARYVGGVAGGVNSESVSISDSYSRADVAGFGGSLGGFAGSTQADIVRSYSAGNVTDMSEDTASNIGGFTGWNFGKIYSSFYVGIVDKSVDNSSVWFGGFAGEESGEIRNSGWWTGAASQAVGAASVTLGAVHESNHDAATTDFFKNPDSAIFTDDEFADAWDFSGDGVWAIDESGEINDGLPYLQWQFAATPPPDYSELFPASPIDADGSSGHPYYIETVAELEQLGTIDTTDIHFVLIEDLVVTDPWTPFDFEGHLDGHFDGDDHSITGLAQPLFGTIYGGSVKNLFVNSHLNFELEDEALPNVGILARVILETTIDAVVVDGSIQVTLDGGECEKIGGLAGSAYSPVISNSSSLVEIRTHDCARVGGFIGNLTGGADIQNVFASESVVADVFVGGLIGFAEGSDEEDQAVFNNVYATSTVHGNSAVGGLIGYIRYSVVSNAYATGTVHGDSSTTGGLVGDNNGGRIEKSYANVTVTSDGSVTGGFVGYNGGVIENAYATGNVEGTDWVGGLVGYNSGQIFYSYSTGNVHSTDEDDVEAVGGFVGDNGWDTIYSSFSVGAVSVTSSTLTNNSVGGFLGYDALSHYNSGWWTGAWSVDSTPIAIGYSDGEPVATIAWNENNKNAFKNASFWLYTTTYEDMEDGYDGEEFGAWNFGDIWTTNGDTTYPVFQWQAAEEAATHTLSFNTQGGSSVSAMNDIEEGYSVTLPPAPSRSGYTFQNWNTQPNGNGTSRAPGASFTMPGANTTLYAIWSRNSGGGGGSVAAVQAQQAASQGLPTLISQLRLLIQLFVAQGGAPTPAMQAFLDSTPAAPSGLPVRDLTVGMSGEDVRALQLLLIGQGYPIPAGATGLFVNQTQAALAAYQAANGIVPPVGYFGPITRAQMKAAGLSGLWW